MEHSSHPKTPEVPVLRKCSVKNYLEELRLVAEIMTGLHHRSACQAHIWIFMVEMDDCRHWFGWASTFRSEKMFLKSTCRLNGTLPLTVRLHQHS